MTKGGRGLAASKARILFFAVIVARMALCGSTYAQSPGELYTWAGTGNTQVWQVSTNSDNTGTLSNSIAGQLTITETGTSGESITFLDGFNKIREVSSASGGLDLTGLEYLEFDIGHNGSGNIAGQWFAQATPGFDFVILDQAAITPGVSTYQVPLSKLSFEQQIYIRSIGFQSFDHFDVGNVTWTIEEVRSGGTPLNSRVLIDHNVGASDNGLQGAIANFELGAIQGNDGGQNQTGLVHNVVDGSLQWIDKGTSGGGGVSGGAVTWANGTAWLGNSFNERPTDVSNYNYVTYRVKATDVDPNLPGGTVGFQPFFQTPSYSSGSNYEFLPIDGTYHDLTFPMASFTGIFTDVSWTGINLGSHTNDIYFDVDSIRFDDKSPYDVHTLFSWEGSLEGWTDNPDPNEAGTQILSLTTTGVTDGSSALQLDRTPPGAGDFFTWGSVFALDSDPNGGSFDQGVQDQIDDYVWRINGARRIAVDITYEDQFPISPSYSQIWLAFEDETGAFYQSRSSDFDINNADPNTHETLYFDITDFYDVEDPNNTLNLATDGLMEGTTAFGIFLGTSSDDGAVYQLDNLRLLTNSADFNGDGVVDGKDFLAWQQGSGTLSGAFFENGDANLDGAVNGLDLAIWESQYGTKSSLALQQASLASVATVPEPSAVALTLLFTLVAIAASRQKSLGGMRTR